MGHSPENWAKESGPLMKEKQIQNFLFLFYF